MSLIQRFPEGIKLGDISAEVRIYLSLQVSVRALWSQSVKEADTFSMSDRPEI